MDKSWLYPTCSMVVVGTWLGKYLTRKVTSFPTFKDYEITKNIIHYSL